MDSKNLDASPRTITFLIALSIFFTYAVARILFLFMDQHYIPSLTLHISNIHIHHFVYGIFLLAIIGYIALFIRKKVYIYCAAIFYGIGIGLAFDEILMWVRLNGKHSELVSLCTISGISLIFFLISLFLPEKKRS